MGVTLFEGFIAGVGYHTPDELWIGLKPGLELGLSREPENSYDPKAVAVTVTVPALGGDRLVKLGYLPRVANSAIAGLMDAGWDDMLECCLTSVNRDESSLGLRINIYKRHKF